MAVSIAFGSRDQAAPSGGVATVTGLTFNAEAGDRIIAASITTESSGVTFTGVTIGGVTATQRVQAQDGNNRADIWSASVPTGTTGNVAVTVSGGSADVSVATFSITGANAAPTDTDSATGIAVDISVTGLTIPTDGAGIAAFCNNASGTAVTWTGAAESHDTQTTGTGTHRHSSAIITTVGTNTVTADGSNATQALVAAAWGPASGQVDYTADLTAGSFNLTGSSVTPPIGRNAALTPGVFALTGSEVDAVVTGAIAYTADLSPGAFTLTGSSINEVLTGINPGPAFDGPSRRRRREADALAYWSALRERAQREEERKRLEALEEAETALRQAEDASKAKARRNAVRKVFAALNRAAFQAQQREALAEAETAVLEDVSARKQEYQDALDRVYAEIEAIQAEMARLYARRQEEETLVLNWWASRRTLPAAYTG
jgi:hypothetical protein